MELSHIHLEKVGAIFDCCRSFLCYVRVKFLNKAEWSKVLECPPSQDFDWNWCKTFSFKDLGFKGYLSYGPANVYLFFLNSRTSSAQSSTNSSKRRQILDWAKSWNRYKRQGYIYIRFALIYPYSNPTFVISIWKVDITRVGIVLLINKTTQGRKLIHEKIAYEK